MACQQGTRYRGCWLPRAATYARMAECCEHAISSLKAKLSAHRDAQIKVDVQVKGEVRARRKFYEGVCKVRARAKWRSHREPAAKLGGTKARLFVRVGYE